MTSNRPLEDWGKLLGDVPVETAILDRFLHHAEFVRMTGRSYRLRHYSAQDPLDDSKPANAPSGSAEKQPLRNQPMRPPAQRVVVGFKTSQFASGSRGSGRVQNQPMCPPAWTCQRTRKHESAKGVMLYETDYPGSRLARKTANTVGQKKRSTISIENHQELSKIDH